MTLLIIDGNNMAHRVRHVFSLTNPDGTDVSVTYGFMHNIKALFNKFHPTACIVAWDGGIPRFRREVVPSYKANRTRDDEDDYANFIRQLQELATVALPSAGILNVRRRAMEADDIMYQAAFMAYMAFYEEVIVVSGDEDMFQVITMEDVYVYHPGKKAIIDEDYIEKECGVSVKDYVHWRALQGDTSDNIKGVPGIGPKRATEYFQKYKSLSGIINAAHGANPRGEISGKIGQNIRDFGIENLAKNVKVMALWADRTGARLAIIEELEYYQTANVKALKDYLFGNVFISLMEPDLYKNVRVLEEPRLCTAPLRTPVICEQRFPIEE